MDYGKEALRLHAQHKGKICVNGKVEVNTPEDLSLAYTPGVAQPCLEIARDAALAYTYTAKGNLVAVVSDGSAVLGLGNIGGQAAHARLWRENPCCSSGSEMWMLSRSVWTPRIPRRSSKQSVGSHRYSAASIWRTLLRPNALRSSSGWRRNWIFRSSMTISTAQRL